MELLKEHRKLMRDYKGLLETLRNTPLYAPNSEQRLYYNESEEDALVSGRPSPSFNPPDPFADSREDEDMLRFANVLN